MALPKQLPTEPRRGADHAMTHAAAQSPRCRLCECRLDATRGDFVTTHLCRECSTRPEAREFPSVIRSGAAQRTPLTKVPVREFAAPDKALIRAVHAYMPINHLLDTINARLAAHDPASPPFTLAHLESEIRALRAATTGAGSSGDWVMLRRHIADARASGVLAQITPQLVQDFAVVFSLAPAQLVRLKDIVKDATAEEGEGE